MKITFKVSWFAVVSGLQPDTPRPTSLPVISSCYRRADANSMVSPIQDLKQQKFTIEAEPTDLVGYPSSFVRALSLFLPLLITALSGLPRRSPGNDGGEEGLYTIMTPFCATRS